MNDKKKFKEVKQAAGLSSKPFYLRKPKDKMKAIVVAGLMLIVMSIVSPFLLIAMPFYLVWAFFNLKEFKSKANILMGEAIDFYEIERHEECLEKLSKVLELEPENEKAKIISALIQYEREEYEEVIRQLAVIAPKIIDNDVDLQIKLADCYIKLGKNENAKGLYEKLNKITGKSDFIKEALKKLD